MCNNIIINKLKIYMKIENSTDYIIQLKWWLYGY